MSVSTPKGMTYPKNGEPQERLSIPSHNIDSSPKFKVDHQMTRARDNVKRDDDRVRYKRARECERDEMFFFPGHSSTMKLLVASMKSSVSAFRSPERDDFSENKKRVFDAAGR